MKRETPVTRGLVLAALLLLLACGNGENGKDGGNGDIRKPLDRFERFTVLNKRSTPAQVSGIEARLYNVAPKPGDPPDLDVPPGGSDECNLGHKGVFQVIFQVDGAWYSVTAGPQEQLKTVDVEIGNEGVSATGRQADGTDVPGEGPQGSPPPHEPRSWME